MKKIISLFLVMIMVLTMTGCSLTKTETKVSYELLTEEEMEEAIEEGENAVEENDSEVVKDDDTEDGEENDAQDGEENDAQDGKENDDVEDSKDDSEDDPKDDTKNDNTNNKEEEVATPGSTNLGVITGPVEEAPDTAEVIFDDLTIKYDQTKKTYDYDGHFYKCKNIWFDGSKPNLFDNDTGRVIRSGEKGVDLADCWFMYKTSGVYEFLISLSAPVDLTQTDGMTYFVSEDEKNWVEVKGGNTVYKNLPNKSWFKETTVFKGIDAKYKYLKIHFPKTGNFSYVPNIHHVQINGLTEDVMNRLGGTYSDGISKNIYVDPKNGNDKNDGRSEKTAIKTLYAASRKFYNPGDQLLLKAGETHNGAITLNGGGIAGKPIKITSYGKGAKPIIGGRGGVSITASGAYIEISNLEITNPQGAQGILIKAYTAGATKGIKIYDCYIHDINKNDTTLTYGSGGIQLSAEGRLPCWFDGAIIEDNVIDRVSRTSIFVNSGWSAREATQEHSNYNKYVSDDEGWYPNRNLKIRNNKIHEAGGDGILFIGAKDSVVERNLLAGAKLFKGKPGGAKVAYAGMWCHSANDIVFQYNEVYGIRGGNNAQDLMAFDADISCKRIIFQYNYTHDNDGGAYLYCPAVPSKKNGGVEDTIVRYNVSVNDCASNKSSVKPIITIKENAENAQIYNNTIYTSNDAQLFWTYGEGTPQNVLIQNNIFIAKEGTMPTYDIKKGTTITFKNNIFHNVSIPKANDHISVSANISKDPGLKKPGEEIFDEDIFDSLKEVLKCYKPKRASNVDGAPKISGNGGIDFGGNKTDGSFYGAICK